MGLQDDLITNITPAPPKVILYAEPGVGKTTFARSANATLIDCENGAGNIPGLKRTPYLPDWPAIKGWVYRLADAAPAETGPVAVDTIDWAVRRIVEYVTIDQDTDKKGNVLNTIGSAHGGWYKARDIVVNIVSRELLPPLSHIAATRPVILLAHAGNTKSVTPEGQVIKIAAPALPKEVRDVVLPLFVEWSDGIFYGISEKGARGMITVGSNLITAKNRWTLPESLPLSWPGFIEALRVSYAAMEGGQG